MIKIGLIGYGYWGPNLARNFNSNEELELISICDFSADRLEAAGKRHPEVKLTTDIEEFFKDSSLDAIAIATPVSTHFEFAQRALLNGKHVWLEKPMTETVEQGRKLIDLAEKKGKVLIVDQTFVYTGAVRKIKKIIDSGELGDLIYYDSMRVNLGLFQQDVDVIWDLAPHDIGIMDYVMPMKKYMVSATGSHFYGDKIIPKSVLTIYMENNILAHINVSWLSPVKIRQTLIGGNSKMILYDDNDPSEKVKIYDKGVELIERKEDLYKIKIQYRVGDIYSPKVETFEALAFETQHFVECIQNGTEPETGGKSALEVVKILEASKKSLALKGAPIKIE